MTSDSLWAPGTQPGPFHHSAVLLISKVMNFAEETLFTRQPTPVPRPKDVVQGYLWDLQKKTGLGCRKPHDEEAALVA